MGWIRHSGKGTPRSLNTPRRLYQNRFSWLIAIFGFGLPAAPALADQVVPVVVNTTEAAATIAIEALGLTVTLGAPANDPVIVAGNVISSAPIAGTVVPDGSAVTIVVSLGPADIPVPNVVGLAQAVAEAAINVDHTVGTVTTANHATVPTGDVISQNPAAGSPEAPGTPVDLVVSSGPAPVTVPNVVDTTQAAATTAITTLGLTVTVGAPANHPTIVAGNVISQNPLAGSSVAPGSAVTIVVSLGPTPVSVPNVVGQLQATASANIIAATLVVGTVITTDSALPVGQVLTQDPIAGTPVAPGSMVNLTVSSGPVAVPNVVNQVQATAETNIVAAGLVVGVVTTSNDPMVPDGSVISQNPIGGSSVAPGSTVDLVVSSNSAPVFTNAGPTTGSEGVLYTYTMTASDADAGASLTFAAPTLPGWLTFNAPNTISGTPLQADVVGGPHDVTVTVTDGIVATPVEQTYQINVADVNFTPVLDNPITPDPQTATENSLYGFNASGFFSDPDDDILTFSATGLPASLNLTIDPVTGVISGTPNHADAAGTPYIVIVSAADAEFSVSDLGFTLNIIDVNTQPVLIGPIPAQAATENATFNLDTSAFFADPDTDLLTFSATGLPLSGNLLIDPATGVLSGSPNDADVQGAPYTILMTATDPLGLFVSDTLPGFTLTITDVNNPPAENPDPNGLPAAAPNADESFLYEFDLSAFFTDADNDPLIFQVDGLPPSGNLSVDPNTGVLSGVPQNIDTSDTPLALTVTVTDIPRGLLTPLVVGPLPINLTISSLDRVDIGLIATAAPDPASVNSPVTWTYTVSNANPILTVQQVDLQAEFVGIPFTFTETGTCIVSGQTLNCSTGPIAPNSTAVISVTGQATQPGDVFMTATAGVPDTGDPTTMLVDPNLSNNTATATLNVGESFSTGPAQTLITTNGQALATGDINGDGFTDLVVTAASGSSTEIYLSEPKDPVTPPDPLTEVFRRLSTVPITLGDVLTDSQDVLVLDLDGDTDLDLVTANGRPGVPQGNSVFFNEIVESQPTLVDSNSPLGSQTSYAIAAADIDGNSFLDLIFANGSPNELFLNQGNGSFIAVAGGGLGNADSRAVVVDDFDGDGVLDLIFANIDGPSIPYRGLGGGAFVAQDGITVGPVVSVRSDDFSGDGLADLIFGRETAVAPELPSNPVYFNTSTPGTIRFTPFGASLGASPTVKIISGDISLDGIPDVVALNATGTHQTFVSMGNGSFNLNPEQFSTVGTRGGTLGDFNNDGRVDLAVGGTSGVDIFFNDGNGNLGAGDITIPVIQLTGATTVPVEVEAPYIDAGATATDNIDGVLTERIVTGNPVDTAVVGTYTVTYNVYDSSGNAATTVTRTVTVGVREGTGGGGGGSIGGELLGLLTLLLFLSGGQLPRKTRSKS